MKTCIDCSEKLLEESFNKNGKGLRPECKKCETVRRKERNVRDALLTTINGMADGILKRTRYALDNPKNRTYKERGIRCLIGENRKEIRESLLANFREEISELLVQGERPTVDRIDPYGHYEIENIRIVSLTENIRSADVGLPKREVVVEMVDGKVRQFESVSAASKELGCKRDTIYASHLNNRITRKGLLFTIR